MKILVRQKNVVQTNATCMLTSIEHTLINVMSGVLLPMCLLCLEHKYIMMIKIHATNRIGRHGSDLVVHTQSEGLNHVCDVMNK